VQNRYSFADREWEHVLDYCEKNGIAFIPWFPLGAGKVAGEILTRIAKAHNANAMQVALAWLLQRSPVMLPIPGTTSVEHLEENLAAGTVKLAEQEMTELGAASLPELGVRAS
jgi:aryl-alcohol dehydrogenase-like predicted oxidoreductase